MSGQQQKTQRQASPEFRASFLSNLIFFWFTKFLVFGYRTKLDISKLWQTRVIDKADFLLPKFDEIWNKSDQSSYDKSSTYISADGSLKQKRSLGPLIFKLFGPRLALAAIIKVVHDLLQLTTPIIFKQLLEYLTSVDAPFWHGLAYASCLLLLPTFQSILSVRYFWITQVVGQNVRTLVVGLVYRKSLLVSQSSRSKSTTGEIINLMSVDSHKLDDIFQYINLLWSAPFQIILALFLMYREIGWSTFAGLGVMLLIIPFYAILTHIMQYFQVKLMTTKDDRIKLINEIFNGIKVIKMYAWEKSFIASIVKKRSKELQYLKKLLFLEGLATFIWFNIPFFVSLVTFATYALSDSSHELSPQKIFVTISLLNLLRLPLSMLPITFSLSISAVISARRISEFLNSDELVTYITKDEDPTNAITMDKATLSWSTSESVKASNLVSNKIEASRNKSPKQDAEFTHIELESTQIPVLKDITLTVKKNSFVAIVGRVASGKSSLLSGMLGEMHKMSGKITVQKNSSIAYVPQQAWIQNMTVKENILFAHEYDGVKYKDTISGCSLQPDFVTFPNGDESEVGESGLNLSGGQKQRLSLARAIYSMSDIYLLDDPLSALDSHIAKHVYDKVLSSTTGSLRNKTRILATNSLFVLPHVDYIYVMDDGKIVESGTYNELMSIENGRLKATLSDYSQMESSSSTETKNELLPIKTSSHTFCEQERKSDISSSRLDLSNEYSKKSETTKPDHAHNNGRITEDERIEEGSVSLKVYIKYFKAASKTWSIVVMLSLMTAAAFQVKSNFWLSNWSADPSEVSCSRLTRVLVYGAIGSVQCVFGLLGCLSLAHCCLNGATKLHDWLLNSIMRSPTTTFFDITPIGRIVNRFAKDTDVIDTTLSLCFQTLFDCFLAIVSAVFVVCYLFPLFFMILLPLAIFYYLIQRIYIGTTRQLKRLESITRSPIYSNFGETLIGISVIRAYNESSRFVKKADELIDTNIACSYPSVVASGWLAIRLEFIGNLISFLVGLYSVLVKDSVNVGLVGLAISYSLGFTQSLSYLVRMTSELEINVVSVERILEYIGNKHEDDWSKDSFKPPTIDWPSQGTIKFDNYVARYRKELDLVLRNINFDVLAGEKIGIVGRTGSGKTSLSLALFRMLEQAGGQINIDGVDIRACGLHDLRSKLTIIPQDSILFSGTLRFNLDPLQLHDDEQIWRALELSHLKQYVSTLRDGLEHIVIEFGRNFSQGQRQLVCLARAILRNSKIIILDEATAAVDADTDKLIQKTIRKQFKQATILTIAHRLETILDSDRILVLDSGHVRELDSPIKLASNESSIFTSLLTAANLNKNDVLARIESPQNSSSENSPTKT